MATPEERLIRVQARTIRHLENHVEYLQTMLYDATHENIPDCDDPNCDHGVEIPVQTPRKEEPVEPMVIDPIVRGILTD